MKRISLILLWIALALGPGLGLRAQNNPYAIDDECYRYFSRVEDLIGQNTPESLAEAQKVNEDLLSTAISKGDKKAQTLYYVERLKYACHKKGATDEEVEVARQTLCKVALDLGYKQYYYYSFELAQNYFNNHGKYLKAAELLLSMEKRAQEENDEYGLWVGTRYLASLYISQRDYTSAKKYILKSLRVYERSEDPTMKRQSVTRQYCDLSDCYPPRSDSMRINIMKAVERRMVHLDSTRCEYYLAKISAIDRDYAGFCAHRDACLSDPSFSESLFRGGRAYFEAIESLMLGNPYEHRDAFTKLGRYPQQKFIADLADEYGYHDIAVSIHHNLINFLEKSVANMNKIRLDETAASMGNLELSADLAEKTQEITRITRMLTILLIIVLLSALFFSWAHIRNLRRHNKQDEARIEELKEANERVMVADAAKTRFVQNMSHEVRTPLNAIVGFSQLLSLPDGSFPEEEKAEFSSHIVNNTKMLTMLLDDILHASAMDSGEYKITIEEGECNYICEAAISSAEHRLQPGVRMYYDPEEAEPYTFRTDPRRVQQILINLLTNACKHTTEGEIRLSRSLSENPGEVTFSVTDTGSGVPADQAERIFDRFTKLNDFVQGTGLGLSICRDIAMQMGGRVFLDTTHTGRGSRFVFVLPIVPPQDQEINKTSI